MLSRIIPDSTRWIPCVAGLAAVLATSTGAFAQQTTSSSIACAEREVLLMTLVEAHGAAVNVATNTLADEAALLAQARSACDNGHASDALPLYDHLIAELTASISHLENAQRGSLGGHSAQSP